MAVAAGVVELSPACVCACASHVTLFSPLSQTSPLSTAASRPGCWSWVIDPCESQILNPTPKILNPKRQTPTAKPFQNLNPKPLAHSKFQAFTVCRYINSMWNNTVDSDQVVAALLRRAIEPLLLLYRVRRRACTLLIFIIFLIIIAEIAFR